MNVLRTKLASTVNVLVLANAELTQFVKFCIIKQLVNVYPATKEIPSPVVEDLPIPANRTRAERMLFARWMMAILFVSALKDSPAILLKYAVSKRLPE